MMDQQSGKFIRVDDLDLAPSAPTPSRPVAQWNLPILAEGEIVSIVTAWPWGEPRSEIVVSVDKIKPNGKLFAHGDYETKEMIGVGDVAIVKGVKFSVRRVNDEGQIGLKMLNATEVALLPTLKPEEPAADAPSASLHPASFEPAPAATLENPSKFVDEHPLFGAVGLTESQIRRREQKAMRLQSIQERREKNRIAADSEQKSRPAYAKPAPGELSNKKASQARGAELAARRKRDRRLAPMLAAQEQARLRLEKEKARRKVADVPSAVVSVVVAGVA